MIKEKFDRLLLKKLALLYDLTEPIELVEEEVKREFITEELPSKVRVYLRSDRDCSFGVFKDYLGLV